MLGGEGSVMDALRLYELPRDLIEEISKDLSDFLIGFVRLHDTGSEEHAELGGSGTLVQIEETYGILTAHHVLEGLPKTADIGLILATTFEAQLHRKTIKAEVLRRIEIARGANDSEGPDLGFLILPPAEVESLKAIKTFYNLSKRRDKILAKPASLDEGIWFLCGFAAELTSDEPPEAGYGTVKGFRGLIGAGGVTKEYILGDFDYFDFEARYGGIHEPPESFGGFSGGGLWQVPLIRDQNGRLRAKERIMSGVAFYETGRSDNRNIIRCHARRSVYGQVVEAVKGIAS